MTMDKVEYVQVPIIDDFAPKYLDKLKEDVTLDIRTRTSHRGDVE